MVDTISERLAARAAATNARLERLFAAFHFAPNINSQVIKPMPRGEVIDKKMFKIYKRATRDIPHSVAVANPSAVAKFGEHLKEQQRVLTQIQEMQRVAAMLRDLSLPTELTINQCHADILPVDKELRKRSRKILKQPPPK